jgi:ATP-dependent protease ClpP protease subunit
MEAQAIRAPETEASEVFEEMNLMTPEQRSEILAQASAYEPESDVRYIIVLSNGSKPAPTVG